jgi:hypothetical protein
MNENKSEKYLLGELLAVLNGDGGQYAVEHGVEAAFKRGLERHYACVPHEPPGRTEYVVGLEREVERLRGIQPELPPRPLEAGGLPRYGLRWDGPDQPVAVPMDDGYWTPFHLAAAAAAVAADDLRASEASASRGWQMADELHLTVRDLTLRAEKAERGRDACAASRQLILEMYEEAVKERDLARAQATVPKPRTSGTGMCPYCGQPAGSSGCQRSHP